MSRCGVVILAILLGPGVVQGQRSDPFDDVAAAIIGAQIGESIGDIAVATANARLANAQASVEIEAARQRFWTEYPSGAGLKEAGQALESLLVEKDLYYLFRALYPREMQPGLGLFLGDIDGGIPRHAIQAFGRWTDEIRERLRGGSARIPFEQVPQRLPGAIAESQPRYEAYRRVREWAEFLAAGREPAWVRGPETYLLMLLMRDLRLEHEAAVAQYTDYADVFGEQRVLRLASSARTARGTRFNDFHRLVMADHPRSYIIGLFAQQTGSSWTRARDDYRRWVVVYGEERVLDAGRRVAGSRQSGGELVNPGALGLSADEASPYVAVTGLLLLEGGPLALARAYVAFGSDVTTAGELDAAFRTYMERHGEDALTRAAEAMIANGDHRYWKSPDLFEDYLAGRRGRLADLPIINPGFTAWSSFATGATVTHLYHFNNDPPQRSVFTLLDVSMAREGSARLAWTYERPAGPEEGVSEIPARQVRLDGAWPAVLSRLDWYRSRGYRPSDFIMDAGEETLVIAGRSVVARWWKLETTEGAGGMTQQWTMWVSDQVPGGIVRLEETTLHSSQAGTRAVGMRRVEVEAFEGQPIAGGTFIADVERLLAGQPPSSPPPSF